MAAQGFLAQDLPSSDEEDEDYNPLADKVSSARLGSIYCHFDVIELIIGDNLVSVERQLRRKTEPSPSCRRILSSLNCGKMEG